MVEDTMEVIGLTIGNALIIPTKLGEFVGGSDNCVLGTVDRLRVSSAGTNCSAVIPYAACITDED